MNELKEMNDEDLVDEFEKTVRYWHYDYNKIPTPKFSVEDLREEVLKRIGMYKPKKAYWHV